MTVRFKVRNQVDVFLRDKIFTNKSGLQIRNLRKSFSGYYGQIELKKSLLKFTDTTVDGFYKCTWNSKGEGLSIECPNFKENDYVVLGISEIIKNLNEAYNE